MIFLETLTPIFLEGIKQSGVITNETAVKLIVEQTMKTNWWQYIPSLILASVGSLFFLYMIFSQNSFLLGRRFLKKIEKIMNRKVIIIKHTREELFNNSMINWDTIQRVNKGLIKAKGRRVLLILHTPGGEIFSTQLLSRILKKYKGGVDIMVPYYAMSGGTLLALSGDELYMNDLASLGPVDPQLGLLFGGFGSAKGWEKVMKIKKNKANDQSIIMNMMGKQYTNSIKNYIDFLLLNKINKKQQKDLVYLLTSGSIEHGYNILKSDLGNYGLKVNPIPDKVNVFLQKIINNKSLEGVKFL